MERNGRSTGILSDGTRVNVYRYQGTGDEWTAALHYPDGGYSALVLSGRDAEFDEHNIEGPHMGTLIPWDAVPGNIKRDIEQRAVESSMVANTSRYRLLRIKTCANCGHHRSMHKYDPSKSRSGPQECGVPGCRCATFRQPAEGERIRRETMETNGRGIYHETAVAKHDMVLVPDHRGKWRIDLVTSAGGNHLDVTGPNRGYDSAEEAFQAALDVQRTRGIRGKSHVWIADRDGGLTDYEPMEANASRKRTTFSSRAPDGAIDDDYVVGNVDRDANIGLFRVRGSKLLSDPVAVSADMGLIVRSMEQDASDRGLFGPAVFQLNDNGSWTHIGNVINGRYQESGGYQGNGRATTVDPVAARELDLYIANTYELVGAPGSIGKSIDTNLRKKLAAGKYDSALAPKAWQYLVDEGAKRYQKEFGSDSPIFNAATRRQVAADFARAWEAENGS